MIKNIILAEDDDDDQLYFREIFCDLDKTIHVSFVADGIQLLKLLRSFVPDLVFLDLEMPYMNGLQCLKEIRANPLFLHLPVIIFSSTMKPANIQTAYEMGAHLFLHKFSLYSECSDCLKKIVSMDWGHPEKIRECYCTDSVYRSFN